MNEQDQARLDQAQGKYLAAREAMIVAQGTGRNYLAEGQVMNQALKEYQDVQYELGLSSTPGFLAGFSGGGTIGKGVQPEQKNAENPLAEAAAKITPAMMAAYGVAPSAGKAGQELVSHMIATGAKPQPLTPGTEAYRQAQAEGAIAEGETSPKFVQAAAIQETVKQLGLKGAAPGTPVIAPNPSDPTVEVHTEDSGTIKISKTDYDRMQELAKGKQDNILLGRMQDLGILSKDSQIVNVGGQFTYIPAVVVKARDELAKYKDANGGYDLTQALLDDVPEDTIKTAKLFTDADIAERVKNVKQTKFQAGEKQQAEDYAATVEQAAKMGTPQREVIQNNLITASSEELPSDVITPEGRLDLYATVAGGKTSVSDYEGWNVTQADIEDVLSIVRAKATLDKAGVIDNDGKLDLQAAINAGFTDVKDYKGWKVTQGDIDTIVTDNKAYQKVMSDLAGYKSGDGYDIAKYLRQHPEGAPALTIAFTKDNISEAKVQNDQPLNLDQWTDRYFDDHGWKVSINRALASESELKQYESRLLESTEAYRDKFGVGAQALSVAGKIGSFVFLPARAIEPGAQPLTWQDWAIGGAQITLIAAPLVAAPFGRIAAGIATGAQAVAGAGLTAETIVSWQDMSPSERAVAVGFDTIIMASVLHGAGIKLPKNINVKKMINNAVDSVMDAKVKAVRAEIPSTLLNRVELEQALNDISTGIAKNKPELISQGGKYLERLGNQTKELPESMQKVIRDGGSYLKTNADTYSGLVDETRKLRLSDTETTRQLKTGESTTEINDRVNVEALQKTITQYQAESQAAKIQRLKSSLDRIDSLIKDTEAQLHPPKTTYIKGKAEVTNEQVLKNWTKRVNDSLNDQLAKYKVEAKPTATNEQILENYRQRVIDSLNEQLYKYKIETKPTPTNEAMLESYRQRVIDSLNVQLAKYKPEIKPGKTNAEVLNDYAKRVKQSLADQAVEMREYRLGSLKAVVNKFWSKKTVAERNKLIDDYTKTKEKIANNEIDSQVRDTLADIDKLLKDNPKLSPEARQALKDIDETLKRTKDTPPEGGRGGGTATKTKVATEVKEKVKTKEKSAKELESELYKTTAKPKVSIKGQPAVKTTEKTTPKESIMPEPKVGTGGKTKTEGEVTPKETTEAKPEVATEGQTKPRDTTRVRETPNRATAGAVAPLTWAVAGTKLSAGTKIAGAEVGKPSRTIVPSPVETQTIKPITVTPQPLPSIKAKPTEIPQPTQLPQPAKAKQPESSKAPSPENKPTPGPSGKPAPAPTPTPSLTPKPTPTPTPTPAPSLKPKPKPVPTKTPPKKPVPPIPLPSHASDQETRRLIKQREGVIAFRMGELRGKDVWHVLTQPYESSEDHLTVIGKKPSGATIVKGPGSAGKTVQLLYGKTLSKSVSMDIGAVDAELEPLSGRKGVKISFKAGLDTTSDISIAKHSKIEGRGKVFPLSKRKILQ